MIATLLGAVGDHCPFKIPPPICPGHASHFILLSRSRHATHLEKAIIATLLRAGDHCPFKIPLTTRLILKRQ
jgi:hypothetical protein